MNKTIGGAVVVVLGLAWAVIETAYAAVEGLPRMSLGQFAFTLFWLALITIGVQLFLNGRVNRRSSGGFYLIFKTAARRGKAHPCRHRLIRSADRISNVWRIAE